MPTYLVETWIAPGALSECLAREWRIRSAVGELRRRGLFVHFDRAIRLSEQGRCVFVFGAASAREATDAVDLADIGPYRVVEAVARERSP